MNKFGWHLPDDDVEFSAYLEVISSGRECLFEGRVVYQPEHLMAVSRYFTNFTDACAIDIGAHIGFWSFLLCTRFKKVYAFEPSESMRALFVRNIESRNVELFPVALADEDGRGSLQVIEGNSGASFMTFGAEGKVECRTLDSYGLTGVGFLKIDVEGAEYLVLKGARQTISSSKPLIIVEQKQFGSRYAKRPEDVRELLGSLGYSLAERVHKDEIFVPAEMLRDAR
ncbi:MAG: hypothetical protein A3I02_14055 [Betaproteobacteria bacterium RIFCSPLOWO2_02_FULL_67_26]|nr:MAG: hypothetical protein A3I02_14055 [Betaproteobacteria bacterium RIFCSPLOWO2_02_FULL_67_26]